jgi:putative transposase
MVFSTKDWKPWLTKEIRYKVHQHIIENCKEKDIFLQAINGYTDHLHCLISLGKDQHISKIAQLIKGESSFWINQNNLVPEKFAWQDDFWAVSVGQSHLERLMNYIKNQEEHHSKKPFKAEIDELMVKYGWQVIAES